MSAFSRLKAKLQLGSYNAFLLLLSPLLLAKKAIKFGRRGHRHEWDMARWQSPTPLPPPAKGAVRVVFVALSWGEVSMLYQFTKLFETQCPCVEVVWAIRERAAQDMAKSAFPNRHIVPMPFDFAAPASQWVRAVAPDVLVVIEKFWWPNLIWSAKLSGSAIVLINGRSRGREKMRYRAGWMSGFQRWVLSAFDVLCFESASQVERVADVLPLGANAQATGNIKFGLNSPSPISVEALESWLLTRERNGAESVPLLVAGSTTDLDEEWALTAWQEVRKTTPCALVLAPRRIDRAEALADSIQAKGYTVSRRSQGTATPGEAPVLVLDSMGELSYLYRYARAAYVGGAIGGRGHNIIEPLAWGVPVAYGPNRGDFEAAQRAAEEYEVGFRLYAPADLTAFWERALRDDEWCQGVVQRSRELIDSNQGALERTLVILKAAVETRKNTGHGQR